jgi:hypothetical protein
MTRPHGTAQRYWNGCRCTACRAAVAADALARKRAKRAPDVPVESMPGERWRDVVGHEGLYQVSDLGRVKSLPLTVIDSNQRPMLLRGRLLKIVPNPYGYGHVQMPGRKTMMKVHQLVLAAFVGPKQPGMITRHLNGDRLDNRLVNLAYGTPSENNFDKVSHGTDHNAVKTHCLRGHPFSGDNLLVTKRGQRQCRACASIRDQKHRAQKAIA